MSWIKCFTEWNGEAVVNERHVVMIDRIDEENLETHHGHKWMCRLKDGGFCYPVGTYMDALLRKVE